MCCTDTQEPPDNTTSIPDDEPNQDIPNTHDQTMDQVPHTYQDSRQQHSTPLCYNTTNLTCHNAIVLQDKNEFW